MKAKYKGVTGYTYHNGREMEFWHPKKEDIGTKNLREVLKAVAGDLRLDEENELETSRGLMELFWGRDIINHLLTILELDSKERRPTMWEFALDIINESQYEYRCFDK